MTQQNTNLGKTNIVVKKCVKSPLCIGGLIGLVFAVIFSILAYYNVLYDLDLKTLTYRFQYFQGNHHPSKDIIILGINNKNIKTISNIENVEGWPFDRIVYKDLVDALKVYGAKSITFDIFFPEHHVKNPENDIPFADTVLNFYSNDRQIIMPTVIETRTDEEFKKYYTSKDLDKFSSLSFKKTGNIRYISYFDLLNDMNEEKLKNINKNFVETINFEKKQLQHKPILLKPYPELFNAVRYLGLTNVKSADDVMTKIPLLIDYEGSLFPTLGFATYLAGFKETRFSQYKKFIKVNDNKIPVIGDNYFLINWYKTPENFQFAYQMREMAYLLDSYKFLKETALKENMDINELQDKFEEFFRCAENNNCPKALEDFIHKLPENAPVCLRKDYKNTHIFIGSIEKTGDLKDTVKTPINEELPGVFVHANIFDNLIQQDYIYKTPIYVTILLIFILSISTGITVLGIKNPYIGLANGLIYWLYPAVPLLLFKFKGIYADIIYIEASIILTYFSAVGYQWISSDKDKKLLKSTFSNYLSPQIMHEVLSDPKKVELGGEIENISILFSDIRGFTSISEKYKDNPKAIVEFLNEYFDEMVEAIIKSEGTIDKFIGDAIMAFWGAPVKKENHAELAIKGALGMVEALEKLKKRWNDEGKDIPDINIGVGINSGQALVGNVGSTKIKSYTVIGDSVNLASRLEGLNKKYAKSIMDAKCIIISEYTYEAVKNTVDAEYLDTVHVKGKLIPVKIYKVKGLKEN